MSMVSVKYKAAYMTPQLTITTIRMPSRTTSQPTTVLARLMDRLIVKRMLQHTLNLVDTFLDRSLSLSSLLEQPQGTLGDEALRQVNVEVEDGIKSVSGQFWPSNNQWIWYWETPQSDKVFTI